MKPEHVGEWDDNVLLISCPCCEADRAYQIPSPMEQASGIIEACQSCGYSPVISKSVQTVTGRRGKPCNRAPKSDAIPLFFFRACPACGRPDTVRVVKGQKPYCTYCREYNPQRPAKNYSEVTDPVAWKRNGRRRREQRGNHESL